MPASDVAPATDPSPDGVRPRAYLPWDVAWEHALYGPDGFYRRAEGPAGHFRTASHAAPGPLARALARLARDAGCTRVVDVGAGRGELLSALAALPGAPDRAGLALHGCDVVPRPAALPPEVTWTQGLDALLAAPDLLDGALVVAWELLDVVPCPVVARDGDGPPHVVLVDPATGAETPGRPPDADDAAWLARWWPLPPGGRAEVGRPRDAVWAALAAAAGCTPRGAVLLAVDYAHTRATRPDGGTLAGYRAGRPVAPLPDGSCDVTAHVALDAAGAAAYAAGATPPVLLRQRDALKALGTGAAPVPGPGTPAAEILAAHAERGAVAELLDPAGLGGFSWLVQAAGRAAPDLPAAAGA